MPKVTLDKITVGAVEVELPETCPNKDCNVSFTDGKTMNLIEHQYVSEDMECFIEGEHNGAADIDYGESRNSHGEFITHTTGYACRQCKTILVTTEEGLV